MNEKAGPLYPNQPLEEVAAEIRFRGLLKVEQIRAAFQEAVRSKYSTLFVPKVMPGMAPAIQHYRLESPEEACGVQLAVNSIGIYARQYPGFDTFFAETSKLMTLALRLIGEIDLTRVGWRYLNAIPFPRENGRLPFGKVFQNQPWLSSALNGDWHALAFTARMPHGGATVNLRLSAGADEQATELETLVFDIDAFSVFDPVVENASTEKCLSEIDRMHSIAREIFEQSINSEYRKFLLGAS